MLRLSWWPFRRLKLAYSLFYRNLMNEISALHIGSYTRDHQGVSSLASMCLLHLRVSISVAALAIPAVTLRPQSYNLWRHTNDKISMQLVAFAAGRLSVLAQICQRRACWTWGWTCSSPQVLLARNPWRRQNEAMQQLQQITLSPWPWSLEIGGNG